MSEKSYHYHKKCHENDQSHHVLLLGISFLVIVIVIGICYAAYLFIDATHISKGANINLTKNLSLTVSDLEGKLYSDQQILTA